MEDAGSSSLPILVLLIILHGAMEFSYAALTNLRRTPLRERSEHGDKSAKRMLGITNDLPRFYITTQILLMLVRFAIVAVVVVNLALPFVAAQEAANSPLGGFLGYLVVLLPIALITYLLGDLVPSAFGIAYADQAAPIVAIPLRIAMTILNPLVTLCIAFDRWVVQMSGGESTEKAVTEEEIMTLVDVGQRGGAIEDEEKEMIYSVLQFGETIARELMIPRPDIVAIEINSPLDKALEEFINSGHSRIPVYENSIDDIKGFLYAKDLLNVWHKGAAANATISSLLRPAYFVPETKRADVLFKEMQERKIHIAIVVDEYGGTAGLVTIEDLIEEIVGDIRDEYDIHEEAEFVQIGEREYVVDGGMNLDDVNELLEIELPTDDNDSIGGYIYSVLGRVPEVGEIIEDAEHWVTMRIEAVENRRIRKIRLTRLEPPAEEESEGEAARAADRRENGAAKRAAGETEDDLPAQAKPVQQS